MAKLSFKEWCEVNGYAWIGSLARDNFERRARQYEEYLGVDLSSYYKKHLKEKT